MKLKSMQLGVLVLVFIFGAVAVSAALGEWKTKTDKVPAAYKEGMFTGQANPADIRGSYTFGDIEEHFGVPVEDLGTAFGIRNPDQYAAFQCKELEALYAPLKANGKEIGTASVRYFTALYKGLPFDASEGVYIPSAALEVLKAKASLTEEQLAALEKITVELSDTDVSSSVPLLSPQPANTTNERVIKGTTTFKQLLEWGVKKEDIEQVINGIIPDPDEIMKNYAEAKKLEFSTMKEVLQKLVYDAD